MEEARVERHVAWAAMALLACSSDDEISLSARDCSASELPPPFCHRAVVVGTTHETHYRLGVLDELRDGVRPLLGAVLSDLRFTLFDPLDRSHVFADVAGPFPYSGNVSRATFGDFDGDGADEIAVRALYVTNWNLLVLDGRSLATKALHGLAQDDELNLLDALDIDGDGTSELVTVTSNDVSVWLSVWSLEDGALVESGALVLDVACVPSDLHGDFDGDARLDLALVSDEACSTELLVLRGGSSDPAAPALEAYPRPQPFAGTVAADIDGDGDDEMLFFHTSSTMTVMNWSADGSMAVEPLVLDVDYDANDGYVRGSAGKDADWPDWLIVSDFHEDGAPATQWFDAGVFPGRPDTPFIPLEHDAELVADYDNDGLSDFTVHIGDDTVVYLSLP